MSNARTEMLPVNFHAAGKERHLLFERQRARSGPTGNSGADVEPMQIDKWGSLAEARQLTLRSHYGGLRRAAQDGLLQTAGWPGGAHPSAARDDRLSAPLPGSF
jgi:hypothetical protein